jgi:tripartite-type tricarboxylate transporter receptor subunit TctC
MGNTFGRCVRHLLGGVVGVLALLALGGAWADPGYPNKPVRIVVPYPPGGPNDTIARLLAQQLSERLKQPFVIDNRAGATGMTGTDQVAKSAGDGYTLLVSASVHVIYPALFKKVPFDPLRDFAPVSMVGRAPLIVSVNPKVKAESLKDLLALAKAQPGQLQYASSGNGSATHLAAEALKSQAGIDMQHIAYKGSAPAMGDVVAGHVPLVFDSVPSSMPFITSGRVRALAVTSAQRSPAVPDLPTIAESGVPGYDITTWYGLWAPAATSKDITNRLANEVKAILSQPQVREKLQGMGIETVGLLPTAFAEFQKSETTKWAKVVKDSGAQLD